MKRDRLWFFGAYQYLRDYDSQPGADPAFPRRYEQNKIFGKLNWRFTPTLQMMQSFHHEKWVNPAPPTISTPFVTTQRLHASVPNMTFAHLTHVMSNRTVWEARVGRFLLRQDADPSSGDRTTPGRTDEITGIASLNTAQITTLNLDRVTAKVLLHRYQSDWLRTDHEFKIGMQFERGEHRLLQIFPGGVRYVDRNGAPFQAVFRSPTIAGGVFITPAIFAADTFRVTDRVTVDAGVRFDHSRAINPDLPVVSPDGRETDGHQPRGRHALHAERRVAAPGIHGTARSPRSHRVARQLRTFQSGSVDRRARSDFTRHHADHNEGVSTRSRAATRNWFRSSIRKSTWRSIPETRSPHTDEFSLALDQEIGAQLRASVAYVRKRGTDFISWVDRGGRYQEQTRPLADGTVLPVFVLTNATSDRRFLLTNHESMFTSYHGLVIAAERRSSSGWQASGSYTFSRAQGLQVMSNGTPEDPQFSTIARPGFLTFGQDPNDLTNATGRLPNDRPHVFRATTAVRLPWRGIRIAANLQTLQRQAVGGDDAGRIAARQSPDSARTAGDATALVTDAARPAGVEAAALLRRRHGRSDPGCLERAQRQCRGGPGLRQSVRDHLWHTEAVHRPTPRDAWRACEPRTIAAMSTRICCIAVILVWLAGCVMTSRAASSDVAVYEWNQIALTATITDAQDPAPQLRSMTIVQVAMHDAVNLITGKHRTYLSHVAAPAGASAEAAAIAAAHTALVSLFASQIDAFDRARAASLAARRLTEADPGIQLGERVATSILSARADDGASRAKFAFTAPGSGKPGVWVAIDNTPALLPGWGNVTPWVVRNSSEFRPPGPPSLDSALWARDYNEVKQFGSQTGSWRTAEQTRDRAVLDGVALHYLERRRADDHRRSRPGRVGHGARAGDDLSRGVRCRRDELGRQVHVQFLAPATRDSQWCSGWQRGDRRRSRLDAALSDAAPSRLSIGARHQQLRHGDNAGALLRRQSWPADRRDEPDQPELSASVEDVQRRRDGSHRRPHLFGASLPHIG